jgi:hypothetical protein
MDKKNLKEITYSSEYVAELEAKIEYLKEENTKLKQRYFISERINYHLEMYKEALSMAITNSIVIGGYDFWKKAAIGFNEQQLYNECIHRNAPNIHKGVAEFYLSLIAKSRSIEKKGVIKYVKCRKI